MASISRKLSEILNMDISEEEPIKSYAVLESVWNEGDKCFDGQIMFGQNFELASPFEQTHIVQDWIEMLKEIYDELLDKGELGNDYFK